MTAMSRNKGAAGERELFRILSYELGVAVRRKLGAARDGGCDGMDVPGWAVEVKRTEVLTLPLFWAQAKRQAEQHLAPAGFVLAQVSREVGCIHGPARPRPRDFSAWGDPLSLPLPRWCELARAWLWRTIRYGIGGMKYELHPLCTLFPRLSGTEFDALVGDIAANGLRGSDRATRRHDYRRRKPRCRLLCRRRRAALC